MKFSQNALFLYSVALLTRSSESVLMKKMMKGAMGSMMMYHPADDHHMMTASMPSEFEACNSLNRIAWRPASQNLQESIAHER